MAVSYEKITRWLRDPERPKFSALFCLDGTGALAAIRALSEPDISILDQVSLVTFGGEESGPPI